MISLFLSSLARRHIAKSALGICLHCDAKTPVNKWSKMRNNYYLFLTWTSRHRTCRTWDQYVICVCASQMRANNLSFCSSCDKNKLRPADLALHRTHRTHDRKHQLDQSHRIALMDQFMSVCANAIAVILRDLFLIILITSLTRMSFMFWAIYEACVWLSRWRVLLVCFIRRKTNKNIQFQLHDGMRVMTWRAHVIWGGGVCVFSDGFSLDRKA